MDVNQTLADLRADAEAIQRERDGHVPPFDPENTKDFLYRMAENIQALDEWLSRGGFKPRDWTA